MKKTIMNVTISPELKNALSEQAKKENRSVSNLVETLLKEKLDEKKTS